jgi:hypothetical protein
MAGNIRRFWRSSLGDYFSRDLRLVKDSESPQKWAETSQFAPETSGGMTSLAAKPETRAPLPR